MADILWAIGSTAIGALWLGAGLAGYMASPLSMPVRLLLVGSAVALLFNQNWLDGLGYRLNAGGALAGLALVTLGRNVVKSGGARRRRAGRIAISGGTYP